MITFAILGLGARGAETYGSIINRENRGKITAVCDVDPLKLKKYGDEYGVPETARFNSAEELLEKPQLADVMIVSTCDRDHCNHAVNAMRRGYHLLLEKPISPLLSEVTEILHTARKTSRKVVVCHVMRYTAYYQYIKRLVAEKTIGRVIAINQIENVSFWHQAHAFVRGNFRNSELTSPMILQKSCHDMDLMRWIVDSPAVMVSSVGKLNYFKSENAPKGSALRCVDCNVKDCPFNAVDFYVRDWKELSPSRQRDWPYCMLCVDPTEEKLMRALREGNYGRCVFACDNDVVDFEQATVQFENGATGQLTMTGFTWDGGRQTKIMGTDGEIVLDEIEGKITIGIYGKPKKTIMFTELTDDFSGHGGGDARMLHEFYDYIEGKSGISTALDVSADSHYMCFAAEESRKADGALVKMNLFKRGK